MGKVLDEVIGHAIGDSIGVPVEFKDRESLYYNPVEDMRRSYAGDKGTWSDDTSMELATIDAFINNEGWNYDDIMINFGDWINDARFTARDYTFDVGRTCLTAIRNYLQKGTSATESGLDDINSNGNGSLMRILPVALYCYYKKLDNNDIYSIVKDISSLTHRHEISILGCYIYVLYVINLLNGIDKYDAYDLLKKEDYSMFSEESLNIYRRILKSDIYGLEENDIKSSGFVVDTLEASLWSLLVTKNYKDAVLKAVNLGGDTDTIAAITGSMAGIIYGYDSIPSDWVNCLARKEYLFDLSKKFEEILFREEITNKEETTVNDMKLDYSFETFQKKAIIRALSLDDYNYIKENLYLCDVSKNLEFQKKFNTFYRVRRNEEWRKKFYDFFEKNKNNKSLTFNEILTYLFNKTGNIEASFSSKLLSSINPNMPIWDQYVLENLNIEKAEKDKNKKLENAKKIYKEIVEIENEMLKNPAIKKSISDFKKYFPEYDFSDIKILDFILWNNRDINKI